MERLRLNQSARTGDLVNTALNISVERSEEQSTEDLQLNQILNFENNELINQSNNDITQRIAAEDVESLEHVFNTRLNKMAAQANIQLKALNADNLLTIRREIKQSQDQSNKAIEGLKSEMETLKEYTNDRYNGLLALLEALTKNSETEGKKNKESKDKLAQRISNNEQNITQMKKNEKIATDVMNGCLIDIHKLQSDSATVDLMNERSNDLIGMMDHKLSSITEGLKTVVKESSAEFRKMTEQNVKDLRAITKEAVNNMADLKEDFKTRLTFCEDRLDAMDGGHEDQTETSYKAFQTRTKTIVGAEEGDLQTAPNIYQFKTSRRDRSHSRSSTATADLNDYRPTNAKTQFDIEDPQKQFYVEILKRLEDSKEKGANDIRIESFKLNDCAKTWIEEFQRKARYSKLAEKKWKDVIGKHMAIAHGPTYDNLYQQHYNMCWLDFKNLFIETFQTQEAVSIARMDLERLNFEEFKDKDAFFEKCYTLVDTIGNTDGASIAMTLMNKFSPEIRRRVHIQGLNHRPREIIRNFRSAWYSERQISEEEGRKKKDNSSNQSNQQSNQQFKKFSKPNDNTKFKPNNGQKVFRNFDKPQTNRPRCHFCNIPGHMEKECYKKAAAERNQQSGSSGQVQQQTQSSVNGGPPRPQFINRDRGPNPSNNGRQPQVNNRSAAIDHEGNGTSGETGGQPQNQ